MDKIVFVIRTKEGKVLRTEHTRDTAERIVRDARTDPYMVAAGLSQLSFTVERVQAVAA